MLVKIFLGTYALNMNSDYFWMLELKQYFTELVKKLAQVFPYDVMEEL